MDEDETDKKDISQKNGGKKTTKTATKRKAEVSIYLALFRILFFLTLLLLTPDIPGATYLACVTNTRYIWSLGTLALSKIKTT